MIFSLSFSLTRACLCVCARACVCVCVCVCVCTQMIFLLLQNKRTNTIANYRIQKWSSPSLSLCYDLPPYRANFYQFTNPGAFLRKPANCMNFCKGKETTSMHFPLFYGCIWSVLDHYMQLFNVCVITEKCGSTANALFTFCWPLGNEEVNMKNMKLTS